MQNHPEAARWGRHVAHEVLGKDTVVWNGDPICQCLEVSQI
jgi:hypothetical protein